jgi:hypothetical protein
VPLEVTFYSSPVNGDASASADSELASTEKGSLTTQVMLVDEILGQEHVVWMLADVKANAPGVDAVIVHNHLKFVICNN